MRIRLCLNLTMMLMFILTACAPKSSHLTVQASNTDIPAYFTKTPTPISTQTYTPTIDPTPIPVQKMFSEKDDMALLYVPAGEFVMGSDDGQSNERPAHMVYLDAFWIDLTEVTNLMFAEFLSEQGNQIEDKVEWFDAEEGGVRIHQMGNNWEVDSGYENYPVVAVSWYGANAYCSWAERRLPTEAEWEKAARSTDERNYPWGNDLPTADLSNYKQQEGGPTEVGAYQSGASPYGVLDMAGNVFEWVNDWYDVTYYESSPESNPLGPSDGRSRVARGGSWAAPVYAVRAPGRLSANPTLTLDDFGFRCATNAE